MGITIKRVGSIFAVIIFAVLGGVRLALDLIGWSTAPDDVEVAITRLDQFLTWLMGIPAWLVLVLVVAAAMWLMWVSWPRMTIPDVIDLGAGGFPNNNRSPSPLPSKEELEASRYSPSPASEAPDVQAYYELVNFTISKLLPTCDALSTLLGHMSEQLPEDGAAKDILLNFGFQSYPSQFWGNCVTLERDINQSEPTLKFADLMHCIREMEIGAYYAVVRQTEVVRDAANSSFAVTPTILRAWETWGEAHNAMLDAYEKIRNDIRFKRVTGSGKRSLFAPRKEVRWGPKVNLSLP